MVINFSAFRHKYHCLSTVTATRKPSQTNFFKEQRPKMQLNLLLSSLVLALTVTGSPAPTRALDARQSVPTLIGTCTVATNLCLAPYPYTPPALGNFTCGRWSNVLGTVVNNPAKFCTVDGHVCFLLSDHTYSSSRCSAREIY